jgi:hypothetical protein
MILNNWLRRYRAGAALCRFCPRSWNRIANVLESIEGVGCRIEKTENGWGWQIVVGDGSDAEPPPGFPDRWLPDTDEASQYQVLQLDADLKPVWDWVRYVVPS